MPAYVVVLRFERPAWDEVDGIHYPVEAPSKEIANATARRQARRDGHIPATGKGRVTFRAFEEG